MRRRVAPMLLATLLASAAAAQMPPARLAYTQLPDARQEARAAALMRSIRCLVCQGQAIADSDADLAGDMRAMIRERIAAGERPEAVRAWLMRRYGDWVSYDPPLDRLTWPLWVLPAVLLAIGLIVARGRFRRRGRP